MDGAKGEEVALEENQKANKHEMKATEAEAEATLPKNKGRSGGTAQETTRGGRIGKEEV